jgi:hypothetical protein
MGRTVIRCDHCKTETAHDLTDFERMPRSDGLVARCIKCDLKSILYVAKTGRTFGYPESWGELIQVTDRPANQEKEDDKFANCYYFFRAKDGTIRRARWGYRNFAARGRGTEDCPECPPHLPDIVKYHWWVVDELPRLPDDHFGADDIVGPARPIGPLPESED